MPQYTIKFKDPDDTLEFLIPQEEFLYDSKEKALKGAINNVLYLASRGAIFNSIYELAEDGDYFLIPHFTATHSQLGAILIVGGPLYHQLFDALIQGPVQ